MFQNSIVALITPFDCQGRIDELAFVNLIEWHIAQGSQSLVIAGTTGESATLSQSEKERLFSLAVQTARGRIYIIAGTGSSSTEHTVALTKQAKTIGVDACIVVTPYYNRPSQQGCLMHYQAIAHIGLPIIVYQVPSRTAFRFDIETIVKLAQIPEIVAIKEATHDIASYIDIKQYCNLPILAGDDDIVLPALASGACGVVSVVANLIPQQWNNLCKAFTCGDVMQAQKIAFYYRNLCQVLFVETNPCPIKYALSLLKNISDFVRLPLSPLQEKNKRLVIQAMQAVELIPIL